MGCRRLFVLSGLMAFEGSRCLSKCVYCKARMSAAWPTMYMSFERMGNLLKAIKT